MNVVSTKQSFQTFHVDIIDKYRVEKGSIRGWRTRLELLVSTCGALDKSEVLAQKKISLIEKVGFR